MHSGRGSKGRPSELWPTPRSKAEQKAGTVGGGREKQHMHKDMGWVYVWRLEISEILSH